ncbi:MAG: hypothetical protein EZS28_004110 [Streblomastix strix]|uniref:Uncharacterized protein n=1 Tax=Streblomastix strix TaxID=222440 RepID=A0A5J4X175_9EUKA|nr:MAG: hypothetical protein EZS28_004110 [Streblomastix strix]
MQVLIEAVGCCGGTGEQCGKVTKDALHDIFNLFYPLQPDRNLFAGHSELVKQIYEDIEEQGGTEDCVSNLYHTWLNVNDNVMSNANLAMKTIFNVCRDRSNKDDE